MTYAELGDVRLFFTDEGTGRDPMLFVHGLTGDSNDWIWQLPHFASPTLSGPLVLIGTLHGVVAVTGA